MCLPGGVGLTGPVLGSTLLPDNGGVSAHARMTALEMLMVPRCTRLGS